MGRAVGCLTQEWISQFSTLKDSFYSVLEVLEGDGGGAMGTDGLVHDYTAATELAFLLD